jgi:hypothetical protein
MNQLSMFEPASGQQLRDSGMEQVTSHNADWSVMVTRLISEEFSALTPTSLFTGEDLHQLLEDRGVEEPAHVNAWAAVIGSQLRRWLKQGVIEQAGAITAQRPAAHSRLIRRYRKLEG